MKTKGKVHGFVNFGINIFVVLIMIMSQFSWEIKGVMADTASFSGSMYANLSDNSVTGNNWPLGDVVTLTVEDLSTQQSPDYTAVDTSHVADWNPDMFVVEYDLQDVFDLKKDLVLTLTDGTYTRSLTLADVTIAPVDPAQDVISGTAPAGMTVSVSPYSRSAVRYAVADTNGNWSADFSVVGTQWDEQTTLDIAGDMGGWVSVSEMDGDSTQVSWRVIRIQTNPDDRWVAAENWTLGSLLTMTISGPDLSYSAEAVAEYSTNTDHKSSDMTRAYFELPDTIRHLEAGDVIKIIYGAKTKSYTVAPLQITGIDVEADRISGYATPGSQIHIWTDPGSWSFSDRNVVADETGYWLADFHVAGNLEGQEPFDLQEGSNGQASEADADGNRTWIDWSVPVQLNPYIHVGPNQGFVYARDWPTGIDVHLTVERSGDIVYTADATVGPCIGNPGSPRCGQYDAYFDLGYFDPDATRFDLQSGDVVTLTGGGITQSMIVSALQVTEVDTSTGKVGGIADPGREVQIGVCDGPDAAVIPDLNGEWIAYFLPSELPLGKCGGSTQHDEYGNETQQGWSVPYPYIEADISNQWIQAREWNWPPVEIWSLGSILTVDVDDPSNGVGVDYTGTAVMEHNPDNPGDPNDIRAKFAWPDIGLQSGFSVMVSGNGTSKTLIVPLLQVDDIDVQADTISGTASVGADVHVWSDNGSERFVTADASGSWMVDFQVEQNGQPVINLVAGSMGSAWITDEDGDGINVWWQAQIPQCQPGDTVTGTVHEHDGITPVPGVEIQFRDFDTSEALFTTVTDQYGQYDCHLPEGDYRILAGMEYHSSEYYDEAVDETATRLSVMTGSQFPGVNFTISPLPYVVQFTFNLQNPLLQDQNVRHAIAYGTDRQRILNEAALPNGLYGMVPNSLVPPEHWAAALASDVSRYPFDPVQARALLDAAGWVDHDGDGFRENDDGVKLEITHKATLSPVQIAVCSIFQQNMEDIGVKVNIETLTGGDFFNALENRDFDIMMFVATFDWGGSLDNEPNLGEYLSGAPYNYAGYSSAAFDAAIANARLAAGDDGKLPHLIEAQRIFMHDLPMLPLFTRYIVTPVATPAEENVTVSPAAYLDIHFNTVSQAGVTTVLAGNITLENLPPNFQLLGEVYDIGTNARFTSAQVCFDYDDAGLTSSQEAAIQLFHLEGSTWVDVTDEGYPDIVNNQVCGTVTSFSPFVVMYKLNQPPSISMLIAPIDPVRLGQEINAIALFSDPDVGDVHTFHWNWGDGLTTTSSGASASHLYALTGVYTITVTATDAAGESDTASFQYVVIYDPDGGFVTGAGWITSPVGAYAPDPTLTGKATFGFVSKYQKGASVPTGNTEFQFKIAELNFKSTSYDWLVIAGTKAQYKGTGTINGVGEYKFMLTAVDGAPDKFRIKIWDKVTGEVIYDNQPGEEDIIAPTTLVQGGSIVIHK